MTASSIDLKNNVATNNIHNTFYKSKHRPTPPPQFGLLSDLLSKVAAPIISTEAQSTLAILCFQTSQPTLLNFTAPSHASLRRRFHGGVGLTLIPIAASPTLMVSSIVTIPKTSLTEAILFESASFHFGAALPGSSCTSMTLSPGFVGAGRCLQQFLVCNQVLDSDASRLGQEYFQQGDGYVARTKPADGQACTLSIQFDSSLELCKINSFLLWS